MREVIENEASYHIAERPHSALLEVVRAMHTLTLEEKAQLLDYLSRALQHDIRQQEYKDSSWDEYIGSTFGSLPNLRFRRDEFGNREVYEVLE
ncbi:MAG: hypothetical protein OXE95_01355 [Chloroflexi bacterium]|nr:hypothetical protein [Chloroflexota bacterium]MCY4246206.1 hypothetical protein [Chloroflexota bacterium]